MCHKNETLDADGFLDNSADNLYWGTYVMNTSDAISKGRIMNEDHKRIIRDTNKGKFGEKHPRSKITDMQRRELCKLYNDGKYTQQILADMFGLHHVTVHNIIKKWSKTNGK